ncbi:hypothetical protein AB0F91_28210 [Amycolatopsis sp. NPDC023774]|uniref:hypothetical protein n=1 Tax=Amycolatopsis sp. NPDC023774 TaxID=3155015 RepID=UPI0033D0AA41
MGTLRWAGDALARLGFLHAVAAQPLLPMQLLGVTARTRPLQSPPLRTPVFDDSFWNGPRPRAR